MKSLGLADHSATIELYQQAACLAIDPDRGMRFVPPADQSTIKDFP
jgi:hypothetical protein